MAVDSKEKRRAAAAFFNVAFVPGVTPHLGKPASWRSQTSHSYHFTPDIGVVLKGKIVVRPVN